MQGVSKTSQLTLELIRFMKVAHECQNKMESEVHYENLVDRNIVFQ